MNEDRRAQIPGRRQHFENLGMVQVHAVDVGADLDPGQAQLLHTALQFPRREFRRLHRHGAQADEAPGVVRHDAGDVVVEESREIQGVLGPGPVAEHDGHGRDDLDVDPVVVALVQAALRVPAVGLHFPEELAVQQHVAAARAVFFHSDPASVPVTALQIRPAWRQDVGVNVDLQRRAHRRESPSCVPA